MNTFELLLGLSFLASAVLMGLALTMGAPTWMVLLWIVILIFMICAMFAMSSLTRSLTDMADTFTKSLEEHRVAITDELSRCLKSIERELLINRLWSVEDTRNYIEQYLESKTDTQVSEDERGKYDLARTNLMNNIKHQLAIRQLVHRLLDEIEEGSSSA